MMAKSKQPEPVRAFNLGDRVRIKHYARGLARVVELRGALGPGGEEVYRVRVGRKPYASHIELMESQLEMVSPAGEQRMSARPKVEGAMPTRESSAKGPEDA